MTILKFPLPSLLQKKGGLRLLRHNSAVPSAAPRPRGRPPPPPEQLAAVADQLCRLIADGHSIVSACEVVGIERRSVHRWMQRNDWFRQRIEGAKADERGVRAAIWLLEHRWPERWAPAVRTPDGRVVRAWTRPPDPFEDSLDLDDPLDAA
jgi:hypothetical protein